MDDGPYISYLSEMNTDWWTYEHAASSNEILEASLGILRMGVAPDRTRCRVPRYPSITLPSCMEFVNVSSVSDLENEDVGEGLLGFVRTREFVPHQKERSL